MRIAISLTLVIILILLLASALDVDAITTWAAAQQRGFQNDMASAITSLRQGNTGAWILLLSAAGAYGFVHAVGPGHGKYLIGGLGLGSQVSMSRLLSLAVASSLAQAGLAIVLVFGGFWALDITARQATSLAENWLAPASYLAIGSIGGVLAWRGARALLPKRKCGDDHHNHARNHNHGHDHACCGHAHGPSVEQAANVKSIREALVLICSIAIRPCTGAIFLLVIAWQMDIQAAGAAAVVVMGLGTALLTSLVAISSVAARSMAFMSAKSDGALTTIASIAQIMFGMSVIWMSLILLQAAL